MKRLPVAIVLGAIALSGCGGGGGGGGSSSSSTGSQGSSTGSSGSTGRSSLTVALPAVALTGTNVSVAIDTQDQSSSAIAMRTMQYRAVQKAASSSGNIEIINGTNWSPVCATKAGVQSQSDTVVLVDTGCVSDLTVVQVAGAQINGTPAIGMLHAVATRDQLFSGQVAVTPLTDIAFASVHLAIAAGRPYATIVNSLDSVAKRLLKSDITGDGVINYNDVLAWRSSLGETPLRVDLSPMYSAYLTQADAGLQADLAARNVDLGAFSDTDGNALLVRKLVSSGELALANFSDGSIGAIDGNGNLLWRSSLSASAVLAANNQYVATANDTSVYIAPVSSSTPVFVSATLSAVPLDIALDGNTVFVTTSNGLAVYRLSGGILQSITSSTVQADHVAALNSQIALITNGGQLSLLKLQPDNTLQTQSTLDLSRAFLSASQMVVSDHTVYIAGGPAGLLRVDISDPSNPVEETAYTEGNTTSSLSSIQGVSLSGNNLIVAGNSGIRAFSVAGIGTFVPSARLYVPALDAAVGTGVVGDSLFFETTAGQFGVSALANVTDNAWEGDHLNISGADAVATNQSSAYIGTASSDGMSEVAVVDFSGPTMTLGQQFPVHGFVFDLALRGNTAVLANTTFGYETLDLQSGAINWVDTVLGGPVVGVVSYGSYDLAFDRSGYGLFDPSVPSSPTLVATYDRGNDSDSQMGVIDGDLLYEARGRYGFDIITLSKSGEPQQYTNLSTSDGFGWKGAMDAWHLAKQDNYLLVAGCDLGMSIIDVSDAAHPKVLSQTPYGQCTNHIVVKNHVAYLMDSNSSVTVVDIADINNPHFVGTFPTRAAAVNGWATDSNLFEIDSTGVSRFPTVRPLPIGTVQ